MKNTPDKQCTSSEKKSKMQKETQGCSPLDCRGCVFLSMLLSDISGRGKLYGKIKYAKQNGKLRFTYYDENVSKMLGYPPGELIGKDPSFILHPADMKLMMKRAKDRISGKTVENEYLARLKKSDGSYILVKVVGASPNNSKGYPEAEFILSTCAHSPGKCTRDKIGR